MPKKWKRVIQNDGLDKLTLTSTKSPDVVLRSGECAAVLVEGSRFKRVKKVRQKR